jgi:iron complex transport system ATP-binding protein
VDQWLEKLGLGDRPSQIFSSLSGGEQQKALIARAMVQQPAILMLDEPGASLDFNWKYELSRIVEQVYVQTQVTVVMVSHEIHILPGVCRRVLLLDKGRIVADGAAEDVLSSRVLSDVYGCRVETVELIQRRYAAIRQE